MLALLQPPNLTRFACLLAVDFTGRAAALQALPPASRQAGGRQNPVDLDRPSVRCMRVRVVCVWTCRCWELLWGFGVRTRQQVKIEANLCLSGPDIYSNTLVFLRKKIRRNKLTTRTSNTTSYEHLWETYEVGRSSVMIKITTDTLLSVTDLGFRCRGAEHLLLLLDTRKTSFIAKKILEESEIGLHYCVSKGMNTFFYP
jgi:hypothetical protein